MRIVHALLRLANRQTYTTPLIVLCLLLTLAPCSAETESKALSNGIRILLTPTPSADFIGVAVFVKWYRPNDSKTACLQELAGHALFFGSLNRSFDSVSLSVKRVGGSLDIQVTPQFLVITCLTVPEQISETAYLIGEALRNAEYSEEALTRARAQITREAKERKANPYESLRYELTRLANQTPEWSPQEIERITPQQVKNYFLKQFTIENIVLSVTGHFEPTKAYRTFDNNFFEIRRGSPPTKRGEMPMEPTKLPQTLPTVTVLSRNSNAYALLSMPAPSVTSTEYPDFLTLQALLGLGYKSRLLRHFREEQGLGYETGVTFFPHYGEHLIAQVQWDTNSHTKGKQPTPEQVCTQIQEEINRIITQPISDRELNRAKQIALGRLAQAHERVLDKAVLLGWYEIMSVATPLDKELPDRILHVTKEGVASVAKTYFEKATLGIVQPKPPSLQ
ncbi:peptidase M16 [Armatimonadota bacterium]|nr:peptidase M16 [Armatimonadota bacterium]